MIEKITPRYKNRLLFIVTLFLSSQLFSQISPTTFNASCTFTLPIGLTQITAPLQIISNRISIVGPSEAQLLQL